VIIILGETEKILTNNEELVLYGLVKFPYSTDKEIAEIRTIQERAYDVVKTEEDPAQAEKMLRRLGKQWIPTMTTQQIEDLIKQVLSPWFRHFLTYDPRPVLMKVRCPVLAVHGERDLQVSCKENLAAIEAALRAGGNKNFTLIKLPNLNHLFQTSRTGLPSEYGKIEETISPTALHVISDWILKVTR